MQWSLINHVWSYFRSKQGALSILCSGTRTENIRFRQTLIQQSNCSSCCWGISGTCKLIEYFRSRLSIFLFHNSMKINLNSRYSFYIHTWILLKLSDCDSFNLKGCPNRVLTGQNLRPSLKCFQCSKPRCIYSKKALTASEFMSLKKLMETQQYSSGSPLIQEGKCKKKCLSEIHFAVIYIEFFSILILIILHFTPYFFFFYLKGDSLHGVIFVRMQMDCNTSVEYAYYSSASGQTRKDRSCHCGEENVERDT